MSKTLYLVRWLHDGYLRDDCWSPGPSYSRLVRAFADPLEAEKFRTQLERGELPSPWNANPFRGLSMFRFEGFRIHQLADLTSMPEPIFLDWLRDVGLDPPEPPKPDWASWWDQQSPHMTDHQRAKVWQALDRLRFYEIVETELED